MAQSYCLLLQPAKQQLFAEVIIPLALPKNYTWRVPVHLLTQVQPGVRVEVTLKNKKYAGIVKRVFGEAPEAFTPKDMLGVLDEQPLVYAQQLQLWQWMADYYMCSEGEVMNAAVPAHFKLNSESILIFNEEFGEDFSMLGHDEYLVAEALLIRRELKMSEVQQILDTTQVYKTVKNLAQLKVCFVWESLKEKYAAKKETYILLNPKLDNDETLSALFNEWKGAPKQMELLLSYLHLLKTEGLVSKKELLKKSGASDAQLKALCDKDVLRLDKRTVNRLPQLPRNIQIDFELSAAQQKALHGVETVFATKNGCLLHGVTGSGKTQVYVSLLKKVIESGKQALYLLPEIALTGQLIRRLQKHFGGYIAVYHSKFNENERVELWNRVKSGDIKIVLGARSSLLLPFQNLGLLIVDEEHEPSFKQQEPAPRYHARDTAVFYASLFDAKVLLGSATPSIESYYNTQTGKYGHVALTERFGGLQLPHIELIDTKPFLKQQREAVIITPPLQAAIELCLQKGKQVILFKNRRGYTPYKVCQSCGWIPQCKHCDVSLTFHKSKNQLLCHYCGSTYPPVNTCAACGSHQFQQRNFGTERIEEELETLFPKARVGRMDVDSVRGKTAHETLVQLFEQGRIDILVGTQMVVKGLDFEKVQLVGILDADSLLHFADFRVHERAFQLMEQVSGRAGRKDQQGFVMIQLAQTGHPLLPLVQQHDYATFAQNEIAARKQFFYPPFSRILVVHFRHKIKEVVTDAAAVFAQHLSKELGQYMVGPAEPPIGRLRNQYLMELLFKIPKDAGLMQRCRFMIQQQVSVLQNDRKFRSVVIIPDVDPV
jgi:primosomal protein N' (replication factor Y) (superfamily II helicase)